MKSDCCGADIAVDAYGMYRCMDCWCNSGIMPAQSTHPENVSKEGENIDVTEPKITESTNLVSEHPGRWPVSKPSLPGFSAYTFGKHINDTADYILELEEDRRSSITAGETILALSARVKELEEKKASLKMQVCNLKEREKDYVSSLMKNQVDRQKLKTLDSEKEANVLLTKELDELRYFVEFRKRVLEEENEKLKAEVERLRESPVRLNPAQEALIRWPSKEECASLSWMIGDGSGLDRYTYMVINYALKDLRGEE